MIFNNFHMHTTFCDGKDAPEEMVRAAIAAGCREIGFSGHSYLGFDPDWTMSPEAAAAYRAEVLRLKEAYKDDITIALGVEQDYCSATDELSLYDYVIGGVHCVFRDGHYVSVDGDAAQLRADIGQWYGGDPYAFVEDYYRMVGELYEKTRCDIVAHFDLVTKFIERDPLFDVCDARYVRAADEALERVIESPSWVEINTGAMSRGYRSEPYPGTRLLAQLGKAKKPVILSSDAHSADALTYGFEQAMELVVRYGLDLRTSLEERMRS